MKKDKESTSRFRLRKQKTPVRGSPFLYYGKKTRPSSVEINRANNRRKNLDDQPKSVQNEWWKQVPSALAIIAIILCVGYELLLTNPPKIIILGQTSKDTLVVPVTPEKYQQYAEKIFSGSLYDRNKLTVNTAQIASDIQNHFPEVANASVTLPLIGNQPTIYIEPDEPSIILQTGVSGNFSIDSTGKAVASITNLLSVQQLGLPLVTDQTNFAIVPGEAALPEGDITFIEKVAAQFKANSIPISSLVLPAQSRELDVYQGGGVPYFVKFNLDDEADAQQQIGTFLATRQYLISNKITPSQYIDARVLGRVYYK